MKNLLYTFAAAGLLAGFSAPCFAATGEGDWLSKDRFEVRLRALGILPDDDSSVNIGGDVNVGNAITPEVDLSYYFTPNIAAELIAATAQHELHYTGDVTLGRTWILPPTVTLQYHFLPDSQFNPYVGAGVNYSMFYGEQSGAGFSDLDVKGGFGVAAQAGFDYWLNNRWGLNFDVKKLWLNADASLNNGTIKADVDLDPWLVGAGISYRF